MKEPLPLTPAAQRVQDALTALGMPGRVIEHTQPTRTAEEAAAAIGCAVAQICKSLIFRLEPGGEPLLVIASGANRVDERKLAALTGRTVARADPDFVRLHTGFAIGGVPPLGHPQPLTTYIDHHLMQFEQVWAAAGSPNAVFPLTPAELVTLTGGSPQDVAKAG
ncbi:MAG: YbaK/EbsC family protein [Anaerolineae bacterium]|jgi:prolyl-tRNA editing enzyme YbaK/EbsC (Cys-tRNA(Pro) deacylase)|nr:YbaK/EbsC family protein [Anaerolineae bacterium]